jgi:hypothetical protein
LVGAPEHTRELARVPSHAAEAAADIRDRGAQLGVADRHPEHRVLEVGQPVLGGADLGDRAIDLRADVPVNGTGRVKAWAAMLVRAANPSWARCARL